MQRKILQVQKNKNTSVHKIQTLSSQSCFRVAFSFVVYKENKWKSTQESSYSPVIEHTSTTHVLNGTVTLPQNLGAVSFPLKWLRQRHGPSLTVVEVGCRHQIHASRR